ncbi:class I SAM-dependent methyltransferase [Clostridium transplantifaecale]|uniref:class I SAM-dependent methyltransferase n=1 Tax=Clostridium transplantifaecale TaxID=2479838 RepID=UPI000F63161F|nr:class I SAM-dependent methyltransferase [Clostridium transplantifaecale]
MENLNNSANAAKNRKSKKSLNGEILSLIDKYTTDTGLDIRRALKENKRLDYLYALAPLRENLLEWYDFKEGGPLLQVGADFGALTGLFLKRTGNVTVLDESEESLSVVKTRYQGTPGLRLECGSLESYAGNPENHGRFAYVTLIGSLHAESRAGEKDPIDGQLRAARQLLAPGGTLILAACNQFGLKYFAGAQRDAVSVTKRKLENCLEGGRFYYPMPDYRLPSSIYSEQYLPKKGDLTGMLALYDYPEYLLMDVGAAYDAVCEDGQFENFANSFLVIWTEGSGQVTVHR